MFKSILVLESPWDQESVKSKSVWPFVNEFAHVMSIKAYHQAFMDKTSFCHWIKQYDSEKTPAPKMLYIAAHGSEGRISGLRRQINGKTIASTLKASKSIKYVHFGSCLYGSEENLRDLLKKAKNLSWAAGYKTTVGWVDSTLFDLMFWGRITRRDDNTKGLKTHTLTQDLVKEIPGLARNLGFHFQYRYGEKIRSLLLDDAK